MRRTDEELRRVLTKMGQENKEMKRAIAESCILIAKDAPLKEWREKSRRFLGALIRCASRKERT